MGLEQSAHIPGGHRFHGVLGARALPPHQPAHAVVAARGRVCVPRGGRPARRRTRGPAVLALVERVAWAWAERAMYTLDCLHIIRYHTPLGVNIRCFKNDLSVRNVVLAN